MSYQRNPITDILNLDLEEFFETVDLLFDEFEEAIEADFCLEQICRLFDRYMPLLKYEAYELDNEDVIDYVEEFRVQLIRFYADGWEDARRHYNNLYDRDIQPHEIDDDDDDAPEYQEFAGFIIPNQQDKPMCAPAA